MEKFRYFKVTENQKKKSMEFQFILLLLILLNKFTKTHFYLSIPVTIMFIKNKKLY